MVGHREVARLAWNFEEVFVKQPTDNLTVSSLLCLSSSDPVSWSPQDKQIIFVPESGKSILTT